MTQFDLLAGTEALIDSSRITISVSNTGGGALQIGPDGKIYTALWGTANIGVINDPNVLGTGCNYNPTQVSLANGTLSQGGLPAFYNSMFVSPQSICDSTAILNLTINNSVSTTDTITICEGGSVTVGTSIYNTAGSYTDTLQTTNGCDSIVNTTVEVMDLTIAQNDTTICFGDSVVLSVGTSTSNACALPTNLQNGLVGYWPFCGNAND